MSYNFYFLNLNQTKELFSLFKRHNIDAMFVGGCVRDCLLGTIPNDLDIAVNRDINTVSKILTNNGYIVIETGLKYGSISAIIHGKIFEITSLRSDTNCDGRACDIKTISNFKEDSKRRDFTSNAIYLSIDGKIFDFHNGIEDLVNRRVIFIGDPEKRIKEDYLRIFRYYRFCAKHGDLSHRYSKEIKMNVAGIHKLAIERIQHELLLILNQPFHLEVLSFMKKDGIFKDLSINIYKNLLNIETNPCIELKLYILFKLEYLQSYFKLSKKIMKKIKRFESYKLKSFLDSMFIKN